MDAFRGIWSLLSGDRRKSLTLLSLFPESNLLLMKQLSQLFSYGIEKKITKSTVRNLDFTINETHLQPIIRVNAMQLLDNQS